MSPERLEALLRMVGPLLAKKPYRSRTTLPAKMRLVITLRYLASGKWQRCHSLDFVVGQSTVCDIIHQTCDAIWVALMRNI